MNIRFTAALMLAALSVAGCAPGRLYTEAGVGYQPAATPAVYGGGVYRPDGRVIQSRCREGTYYPEINQCVIHAGPTAPIKNDPECVGQPSGHPFDRAVVGPGGMPGVDHRVCS
jgi:hypothetical protein